jgi:hypothetical protein
MTINPSFANGKVGSGRRAVRSLAIVVAAIGLTLAAAGPAHATPINLVVNGGFETGDFTGWTQSGNTGFTGVQCPGAPFVPEGNCDAFFGPVGSDGILSQTLTTVASQPYTIVFTLVADGGVTSDFSASFGGVSLLALSNPAAGTTVHTFFATASSSSSILSFGFRDDPGFLSLDGVSVTSTESTVPEPASLSLLGIGLAGMFARHRARKQTNRV